MSHGNKMFSDEHITVGVLEFDPKTGKAIIGIEENKADDENVGFYFIWVKFASNDSTRIDYDGGNPHRVKRPPVSTSHRDDSISGIEAKRVRDTVAPRKG
jgi:hypothetical protein